MQALQKYLNRKAPGWYGLKSFIILTLPFPICVYLHLFFYKKKPSSMRRRVIAQRPLSLRWWETSWVGGNMENTHTKLDKRARPTKHCTEWLVLSRLCSKQVCRSLNEADICLTHYEVFLGNVKYTCFKHSQLVFSEPEWGSIFLESEEFLEIWRQSAPAGQVMRVFETRRDCPVDRRPSLW